MLSEDDLRAAVREGIVTEDQAARLLAFTREQQGGEADYVSRDEPFRLFRGFRDFFLALGLVILAVGLAGGVVTYYGDPFPQPIMPTGFTISGLILPIAALGVFAWLAAEWITRHLRLPLSSIVIVSFFCLAAGWLTAAIVSIDGGSAQSGVLEDPVAGPLSALAALIAAIAFYFRFRLPFVLLPLAAAAVGTVVLAIAAWNETWLTDNLRIVTAISGIAVFAGAMRYDLSDPNRLTRRSECAFWLHLLAAPLIVHSVIGGFSGDGLSTSMIFGTIAILGLVALLIDRRALLVSALIYLATAISQTLNSFALTGDNSFVATALVLGLIVVTLGLGWTPIRNALIRSLPDGGFKASLPPASRSTGSFAT